MNRREFLQISAAAMASSAVAGAQAQIAATRPATRAQADPQDAELLKKFGARGVRVHDPSTIVKCKDEYWIYYTGRGVGSYHSKDLISWQPGPRVFDTAPAWAATAVPANRGNYFWAPEVVHAGDKYLLYYVVSTFGKNVSAIGVASNPTLDPADAAYHWTDMGIAMQSAATDKFNAIDPAIVREPDGKWWLSFGSFWSGIKLIELDPATGRRITPDSTIHSIAANHEIEASYIYYHGGYHYLIVNWGLCCKGINSTYNMRIGRSREITGPYLDKDGKDLAHGGGTLLLGTQGPFIGPGQAGIFEETGKTWMSMHFYDGTRGGISQLAIRPITWGDDGWPVVEEM